jgi:2-phospho-L-lactate guanylyltransferase
VKPQGIVVIVPMKTPLLAKSRLAAVLTPSERASMSLAILERVGQAAIESSAQGVWIVGGDEDVRLKASALGAEWRDDDGHDLNSSLWRAFQEAFRLGLAPMYLPADLPFLTSNDIAAMIDTSDQGQKLALSPAHRDGGTNSIIVPAGSPFRPELGVASFQRHLAQAEALGLAVAVCDRPGLGLDLDTPDDLRAYEAMEPGLMRRLTVPSARRGLLQ